MEITSPDPALRVPAKADEQFAAPAVALSVESVGKEFPSSSYFSFFGGAKPKSGTRALTNVSFEVRQGETVGLLGPNGAGKTTLLKILSTSLQPSEGRVLLYGQDISRDPRVARGRLGLVTCDERSFYWRLSGLRNLRFFAALYRVAPAEIERRISELLDALDMTYAAHRPFHSYSSGMKQKLAIARGLLAEPDFVLYDEPTRSLDPLSTANIRTWLLGSRKKNPTRTHLIATHRLDEAEQLCDRVVIINRGRLIAADTIAGIRRNWSGEACRIHRIIYRGDVAIEALSAQGRVELEETDGAVKMIRLDSFGQPRALSAVLEGILARGGTVLSCRTEEATFDEIFCSIVDKSPSGQPAREGVR